MMTPLPHRGKGRRKSAIALVELTADTAQRTINQHAVEKYFPIPALQKAIVRPLEVTSQGEVFGFRIRVRGGGKAAQAQAAALGLARALLASDAGFRKQLKQAGLLTRDARVKERKKPGLKRARRAPQFSKR